MAGELQLGGTTLATHTGSGASAKINLDSGLVFPDGHVLQCLQQTLGSTFSSSSTHTSAQTVTGLTKTITVGTGNSVLVMLSILLGTTTSDSGIAAGIFRDSTEVQHANNFFYTNSINIYGMQNLIYLDDCGAGTFTYSIKLNNRVNSLFYVNPNAGTNCTTLTLFEIKGQQ